ncbi:MAG: COX15/CtaA family protein [Flavobacteriaceae bacterium]
MNKTYSFFLIASLVLVYLVIAAGSIVRMTGSGMGCPDWPKCFGYIIPPTERSQLEWKPEQAYKKGEVIIVEESLRVAPRDFTTEKNFIEENWEPYTKHDYAIFNPIHTWIEFLNRLLGALAGLATVLLFVFSLFKLKKDVLLSVVSFLIVLGMGFQAWLGKTVVDSNLLPYKITLHMIMALLLVLLLIFLLERNLTVMKPLKSNYSLKATVAVGLFLTLVQIGMGTQVRQFVDVQMKYWGLEVASQWLSSPPFIFYFHRSFSLLVIAVHGLIAYQLYQNKQLPLVFKFVLILIGLEVVTGIGMYYFDFPFSSQPLHLILASLLFGAQSFFMIRLIKQR